MKKIALDIETTGIQPDKGNRIIELAMVEFDEGFNRNILLHQFYNPEKELGAEVSELLGISDDFLAEKPLFIDDVARIEDILRGAELVFFNAPFDSGFLDAEFARTGQEWEKIDEAAAITDTLMMARERLPAERHSLDYLCNRFRLNNRHTSLTGSLRDAHRIIDVYACLAHLQTEDQEGTREEKEDCVDITESIMPGVTESSWICYNNIEDLKFGFRAHGAVNIELETLDMLDQRSHHGTTAIEDFGSKQLKLYESFQRRSMNPSFRIRKR